VRGVAQDVEQVARGQPLCEGGFQRLRRRARRGAGGALEDGLALLGDGDVGVGRVAGVDLGSDAG
jgi:hypothetical protein